MVKYPMYEALKKKITLKNKVTAKNKTTAMNSKDRGLSLSKSGYKALINIIPKDQLAERVVGYRTARDLDLHIKDILSKTFEVPFKGFGVPEDMLPKKKVDTIVGLLNDLRTAGWITKCDSDELAMILANNLANSPMGIKFIATKELDKAITTGGRQQEYPEFDVFVIELIDDIKALSGNPRYELVLSFLQKNKLVPEGLILTRDAVRLRYQRQKKILDTLKRIIDKKNKAYKKILARINGDENCINDKISPKVRKLINFADAIASGERYR